MDIITHLQTNKVSSIDSSSGVVVRMGSTLKEVNPSFLLKNNHQGVATPATVPTAINGYSYTIGEDGDYANFGLGTLKKFGEVKYSEAATAWQYIPPDIVISSVASDEFYNALKSKAYYYFNGSSVVTIPDDQDLAFGTNDFTLNCNAFVLSKPTSGTGILLPKKTINGVGVILAINTSGELVLTLDDGNGEAIENVGFGGTDLSELVLCNIFVTFDRAGNASAYINGVLEGNIDISGLTESITNTAILSIGGNESANYFNGYIWGVRAFNYNIGETKAVKYSQGAPLDFEDIGASNVDILSGFDFTSGWEAAGTASIINSTSFSKTEGAGGLRKICLAIRKIYLITLEGSTDVSDLYLYNKSISKTYSPLLSGNFSEQFIVWTQSEIDSWLYLRGTSAGTTTITTFTAIQLGYVLDLNHSGIGHNGWTGILGGEKISATNNGATVVDSNPNRDEAFITDVFTTDIASGVGSKIIKQPAGYEVEDIVIIDKGTAAGLTNIQCVQETSAINLITGKSLTSGNSQSFRRSIADHNIYSVDKNLTFTATGNGSLGMQILVIFKKVQ